MRKADAPQPVSKTLNPERRLFAKPMFNHALHMAVREGAHSSSQRLRLIRQTWRTPVGEALSLLYHDATESAKWLSIANAIQRREDRWPTQPVRQLVEFARQRVLHTLQYLAIRTRRIGRSLGNLAPVTWQPWATVGTVAHLECQIILFNDLTLSIMKSRRLGSNRHG